MTHRIYTYMALFNFTVFSYLVFAPPWHPVAAPITVAGCSQCMCGSRLCLYVTFCIRALK